MAVIAPKIEQSITPVAALRLINDEVERHLASGDFDNASLVCQTGFRLLNKVKLPPTPEALRLARLMRRFSLRTPAADPDVVDTLLERALAGLKPLDAIEACKVTHRSRPTPIDATAGG